MSLMTTNDVLKIVLNLVCLCTILAAWSHDSISASYLFEKPRYSPTLEFNLKGNSQYALGQLEAMLPLQITQGGLWFTQVKGLWDDNDIKGWNIGLGYRHQLHNWVVGTCGFFNRKLDALSYHYSQITIGAEILGTSFEARMNGYIPATRNKIFVSNVINQANLRPLGLVNRLDQPLTGIDIEIGGEFLSYKYLQSFLAYYHFSTHGAKAIDGLRLRGEWNLTSHIMFSGKISYDQLRKYNYFIGMQFRMSIRSLEKRPSLIKKMTQMVVRKVDVGTNYYRVVSNGSRHKNYQPSYVFVCSKKTALPPANTKANINNKIISDFSKRFIAKDPDFIEVKQFITSSSMLN